jgi:hypothetical protein
MHGEMPRGRTAQRGVGCLQQSAVSCHGLRPMLRDQNKRARLSQQRAGSAGALHCSHCGQHLQNCDALPGLFRVAIRGRYLLQIR